MPPRRGPGSPPEEEIPIRRFPVEIQTMVFTEALSKPHIHWMVAGRVDQARGEDGRVPWTLKFNAKPEKNDPSGFRLANQLSRVAPVAQVAVQNATMEKVQMPFTQRTLSAGTIDASTDIVCVEFDQARRFRKWRNVRFAREHQFLPQVFIRDEAVAQLGGIRKVAITYDGGLGPFRCLNAGHSNCHTCPEELIGFLDCFPDLEEVYVIVRWKSMPLRSSKDLVHAYWDHVFSLPQAERRAKNIGLFHSRKTSFIEVQPGLVDINRIPFGYPVANLLRDLKGVFNRQNATTDQYTMSAEKRHQLKCKMLVERVPR